MTKEYRVEIQALAVFTVKAENKDEAKSLVENYHSTSIGDNGSIFYESFDHKNATVSED